MARLPRRRRILAAAAACLLATASGSLAAPAPAFATEKFAPALAGGVADSWIVALRGDAARDVDGSARSLLRRHHGVLGASYRAALPGFAARLSAADARRLSQEPQVAYVAQNSLLVPQDTQIDPPWHLDALDQHGGEWNDAYTYDTTGQGVHVYVVDSGMRHTHTDFGGRATGDVNFVPQGIDRWGTGDCSGHGTQVAGVIGGRVHGVAKGVRLHTVRVGGCTPGQVEWAISALDWIVRNAVRPAVVNVSLATTANPALDAAVGAVLAAGIPVVAAAGNHGRDACEFSPARVPDVITVGMVHALRDRLPGSNFGPCVDLFSFGDRIPTTTAVSDTSTTLDFGGTSAAAPIVTGAVARYLQRFPTASPPTVAARLADEATRDRMADPAGAPNLVLYADPGGPGNDGFSGRHADVNGDGRDDIVSFTRGASADVHVALSNGATFGAPALWHTYFGAGQEFPMLGDVNGDRRDDLITFTRGNTADVYVALSTGTSFGPSQRWHTWFAALKETPLVGDFNGDGRADLATFVREGVRDVYVALSDGTQFVGSGVRWHSDFVGDDQVPLAGDVNGDGRDDVIAVDRFTGTRVNIGISTGSGFVISYWWLDHLLTHGSSEVPVVGDFDGDRRADLAAVNLNQGYVDVALSTGTRFLPRTRWGWIFPGGGAIPGAGDFTGDGRADMVAFSRGTEADVHVLRSSGTYLTDLRRWHDNFAVGTAVPMPASLW
ncbi:S8 family serine peptidase [Micromonospora sp. NPDC126480]|uniref:S8 family serine peptidase n=1 Tax=Micromonospora sp. NPDC126480 TaxID=3155312 RepID=UPI003317C5CE